MNLQPDELSSTLPYSLVHMSHESSTEKLVPIEVQMGLPAWIMPGSCVLSSTLKMINVISNKKGPSMRDYSTFSSRVLVILLKEWTESLHRQRAYVLLSWPEAINSWSLQKQEEEIEAIRRALAERQNAHD